jgi:lipopolysaccharide/colanic/teichoic acid biosynthesis glycosyltransferase
MAKMDYLYASTWSVWADLDILLATVVRVCRRRGH